MNKSKILNFNFGFYRKKIKKISLGKKEKTKLLLTLNVLDYF